MRVRIGQAVRRKEDQRLLTGQGSYADDVRLENCTYAVIVRAPHAHARMIRSVDTGPAKRVPGVLLAFSAFDPEGQGLRPIPHVPGATGGGADIALINRDGSSHRQTSHPVLCHDKVRFIGEPVAIVVGETIAAAKDGAEAVEVDYEPLPAVTTAAEAAKPDAPVIWDDRPNNMCIDADVGDKAAVDAVFAAAPHKVKLDTWVNRVTGVHLEPRTASGIYHADTGRYTLYASGGMGLIRIRADVAAILGVPDEQIQVLAKDVGGSFGTRNATYPEYALICVASRLIGRPVKQVFERSEAFLADYQARDLTATAELALDKDGRFLAMRCSNLSNIGAYAASYVALNKGAQLMTTVYQIPVAYVRARAVMSNTPPTIPFRSAGRPEAIFITERLVDLAADECGFDPVELRRLNMVGRNQLPRPNNLGLTYDSGDYPAVMERALELGEWTGFAARKAEIRKRGLCRGIGVANYIEGTSGMPRERTSLTFLPGDRIAMTLGTMASGQGHETSFPQLVSDWLGVPIEAIDFNAYDTDITIAGGGSHSGRSMRIASLVIQQATKDVIAKGKAIAAYAMEVEAGDIDFADGQFVVQGTNRAMDIFEVADAGRTRNDLPDELRGNLGAVCDQVIKGGAFPYGTAVCEVEVDPDTGKVQIVHYASVDDVGLAVNPMILHGQTHGGIVMGCGQALMERSYYDPESGQLLAGSMMDYGMPRADDFPSFVTDLSEVPATSHPLGIRPGGEGGCTPALAVTVNAIVDALSEFGVKHIDMPATPLRVWQAIQEARK